MWTFEEHDGAVTVHTEESWSGAVVQAQPYQLQQALEQSLTDWLRQLKTETENRKGGAPDHRTLPTTRRGAFRVLCGPGSGYRVSPEDLGR
ncbi:hypothetical protein QF026_008460 [Streptomyces aurantiacus]|nr:hypothetical protein [Streptomyces aurantiacus]